jgi:hypothetical protein
MWEETAAIWGVMAMATFGALGAIATVFERVRSLRHPPDVAYLLLVQNQEQRVEGVVRSLAWATDGDLLLADLGSVDDSPAILERLVREYPWAWFCRFGAAGRVEAVDAALRATAAHRVVIIELTDRSPEKGKH